MYYRVEPQLLLSQDGLLGYLPRILLCFAFLPVLS